MTMPPGRNFLPMLPAASYLGASWRRYPSLHRKLILDDVVEADGFEYGTQSGSGGDPDVLEAFGLALGRDPCRAEARGTSATGPSMALITSATVIWEAGSREAISAVKATPTGDQSGVANVTEDGGKGLRRKVLGGG